MMTQQGGHRRSLILVVLGALVALVAPRHTLAKQVRQKQKMVHQRDEEHPHRWIAGPPTSVDCSLSSADFEYYLERCHDETTQWWVNGRCKDGVKTEVSELHRCQTMHGSRPYCHDCTDGTGNVIKHVCGSDSPDAGAVCSVALSSRPKEDCPDKGGIRSTVYSHKCTSRQTSSYLLESFHCEEGEVHEYGPDPFACGREWYYSFHEGDIDETLLAADPALGEQEQPFSTPRNEYCLDCGVGIGVCASDPKASCGDLGLPAKGSNEFPTGEAENSRYEGGER